MSSQQSIDPAILSIEGLSSRSYAALSTAIAPSTPKSLLFIDAGVADSDQLMANAAAGTQVYRLGAGEGLDRITQILSGLRDVASVQIVSHGRSGGLQLGASWLDLQGLPGAIGQLKTWGDALTADADILLYGCNVAQGELGQAFVNQLAELTGADVAASIDVTGNAALGGNWDLEYQTGAIDDRLSSVAHWMNTYTAILPVGIQGNADTYTIVQNSLLQTAFAESTLTMTGAAGDSVSQGRTYSFDLSQGNFSGRRTYPTNSSSNNAVTIRYFEPWGDIKNWSLNFFAPNNQLLVAGQTYTGATRFPFQAAGFPGLDVSGEGRGNNTLNGQFTINSINYGTGDQITSLDANFEQRSGTSTTAPTFRGRVRYGITSGNLPGGVLTNDVKTPDYSSSTGAGTITASVVNGPSNGQLTFNSDGSFNYLPNANFIGTDSFTYQAKFNGQTSNATLVTLKVVKPTSNQVPVINNGTGNLSYIEAGAAIAIVPTTTTITDADNPANFNAGQLIVKVTAGYNQLDQLTIATTNGVTLNGNSILVNGIAIGTFTGGENSNDLVITLNTASTATTVTALLKSIVYRNTATNLKVTGETRTLSITMSDGQGGTSTALEQTIAVKGKVKQREVMLRNESTGAIVMQFYDGLQLINQSSIYIGSVSNTTIATGLTANWQIKATYDFNNDGNADVLWQNVATGSTVVWEMNGNIITKSSVFTYQYNGSRYNLPSLGNWEIIGLGNTQDLPVLFFQDRNTGEILTRQFSGYDLNLTASGVVKTALGGTLKPGTDWKAIQLADFNNDRNSDVLFQSKSTGQLVVWNLKNDVLQSSAPLGTLVPTGPWSVQSTGQLTKGDTQIDLLLYNKTTGGLVIDSLKNGKVLQETIALGTGNLSLGKPGKFYDLDGDTKTEGFWINSAGKISISRLDLDPKTVTLAPDSETKLTHLLPGWTVAAIDEFQTTPKNNNLKPNFNLTTSNLKTGTNRTVNEQISIDFTPGLGDASRMPLGYYITVVSGSELIKPKTALMIDNTGRLSITMVDGAASGKIVLSITVKDSGTDHNLSDAKILTIEVLPPATT
jgi:Domain of unknown function (DUF4347)/Bacterial Ig domain